MRSLTNAIREIFILSVLIFLCLAIWLLHFRDFENSSEIKQENSRKCLYCIDKMYKHA